MSIFVEIFFTKKAPCKRGAAVRNAAAGARYMRGGCVPREGSGEGGALQEIFCDFRQVGPLDLPAKIALTADKLL